MIKIIKAALIIVWKDLYTEWKTRQIISNMLLFSGLVVVTFSFTFDHSIETVKTLIPGLIWVITIFSGILALNQSFLKENQNENIQGIIISPIDPSSIFLGKIIVNLILVFVVQLISFPALFILFDYHFIGNIYYLMIILFVGTFGFVSVGTFLAAISANSKNSEMLLPVILFPVIVPVVISVVQATKIVLAGQESLSDAISWMHLVTVYDVVTFVLGFILIEYVLEV